MRSPSKSGMRAAIIAATIDDLSAIEKLLSENRLPVAGLSPHLPNTLVARSEAGVIGCAALEVYGSAGLLRSVVVASTVRDTGVGGRLVRAAIELARTRKILVLYLLTTTADRYFPRFGFTRVTRADVESAVQHSIEFTTACPAEAIVMQLLLA